MYTMDEIIENPVNWVNGMLVSSTDLNHTDMAWNAAIRDTRAMLLKGAQFGLLPSLRDSRDKSYYPKFVYDPLKKELTLLECRAVTEGGYRIEITENMHLQYQIPASLPAIRIDMKEDFEVYITIYPQDQLVAGPMSTTAPPRRLYKSPKYDLSIFPLHDRVGVSGINHMKLAEFLWKDESLIQNKRYIPPCFTLISHHELIELHQRYAGLLNSINETCLRITTEYRLDPRPEVNDGAKWSESILLYLSSNICTYIDILPNESPIQLITFFKNFISFVSYNSLFRINNTLFKEYHERIFDYKANLINSKIDYYNIVKELDKIEEILNYLMAMIISLQNKFRRDISYKVEKVNIK